MTLNPLGFLTQVGGLEKKWQWINTYNAMTMINNLAHVPGLGWGGVDGLISIFSISSGIMMASQLLAWLLSAEIWWAPEGPDLLGSFTIPFVLVLPWPALQSVFQVADIIIPPSFDSNEDGENCLVSCFFVQCIKLWRAPHGPRGSEVSKNCLSA